MTAASDPESARKLFCLSCDFVMGAVDMECLPAANLPEVAFVGRSNVGKSSLINALTGRNTLARTSNTPGRTQQLNFFNLGDRLMLVDLPGYGYAKVSRSEAQKWQELMRTYLRGRPSLRRVCVLVDARHGLKPSDREMMEMLDIHAVSYQLVLTKADKIKPPALVRLIAELSESVKEHAALHPEIMATSSVKGLGINDVQIALAGLQET